MTDYTTRLGEALERMKVYSGYESPFCWEIDLFRNAAQILHRLLTEGPTDDELAVGIGVMAATDSAFEAFEVMLNKAVEG